MRLRFALLCTLLFLPSALYAQDATVIGTVKDTTEAVLPGVTVTALNLESGNTFVDVSDGSGNYRLALRPGLYKVTAVLTGFTPAERDKLELLIGQRIVIDLHLKLSTVSETITVTGETPLVETGNTRMGGNIDRRQIEDLPVNGRNFLDLTMLSQGSRANSVIEMATPRNNAASETQINVDGQMVTQMAGTTQDGFGNPRYSKDAIAEFEVVTNRFDATQGHATGGQINAITKSGTNRYAGTAAGYFRDDKFNAADFIANRVLPYQDQQLSGTFGGPFIKDKFHFFGNYEYERNPQTKIFNTPYPLFNAQDLSDPEWTHTFGLKLDYQINPRAHAMVRGSRFYHDYPVFTGGGSTSTVSNANTVKRSSDALWGQFSQTIGAKIVNEVKGGYNAFFNLQVPYVDANIYQSQLNYMGSPTITLNGLSFGGPSNLPQRWYESRYTLRDDLTKLFSMHGQHEVKSGLEFLHNNLNLVWENSQRGILTASNGKIPANIEQLFPNQYDWHTWNLAALSSITTRWSQAFGYPQLDGPANIYSGWIQDNWRAWPRVTVNLGLRYEYAWNQLNEEALLPPFLTEQRSPNPHDFSPRIGTTITFNDGRTAIRGGFGRYVGMNRSEPNWGTRISTSTRIPSTPNDGRPNFAADPYNGKTPTVAQAFASVTDTTSTVVSPDIVLPRSWQSSIGVEQQVGETMSFEADWVWQGNRSEMLSRNMNLSFDANGVNYPYTDVAHRPFPTWGIVNMLYSDGTSDYQGLQTSFTKRLSKNWQIYATYTLSGLWDFTPCYRQGLGSVTATCPVDIGGVRSLATTDQRHRATINGIWTLPYGMQLSGLYFFGSGMRFATTYGGDLRLVGAGSSALLGPGGVEAPRNAFVGLPLHRVDLRLMKRVKLGGNRTIDGIVEVFNLFNHANYGSYSTNLSVASTYGLPTQNLNQAYLPRLMQLGFRFAF
jgi:hypothetical protein